MASKPARTVTISLPPDLARKVDALAKQQGRTRSELFRAAIIEMIDARERWDRLLAYGRAKGRRSGLTEQDVAREITTERRKRQAW